ncbi:MAG: DNA methyltransferase [Candidatus Kaiserbacteria bacterium]|nr:DNA methyltransferase [Candidatus Kaiserbacteria bacterium]
METTSRNKTLTLHDDEKSFSEEYVISVTKNTRRTDIENKIVCQSVFDTLDFLPNNFINLVFADPPYNIDKKFNDVVFKKMDIQSYEAYTEAWVSKLKSKLTHDASLYVCGDWRSSPALHTVLSRHFIVRNRITFEREKGRGAKTNYKNCSEDIFFCTNSNTYTFNVETVKLRKKVIAPYRENGKPKDWKHGFDGTSYRDTFPSNIWTDITIPFWSMKENTEHPTQKPEKLLAKILLASSNENDLVFDPFLGSGTTSVVAEKLNRRHVGIEIDRHYCLIAQKRLRQAKEDKRIQGYTDGVFWERNAGNNIKQ